MIGSQGPAPGIRSPARTDLDGGGPLLQARRDGSIQFAAAKRLASRFVTTQTTLDPVTPLKTRAEAMRGSLVDALA